MSLINVLSRVPYALSLSLKPSVQRLSTKVPKHTNNPGIDKRRKFIQFDEDAEIEDVEDLESDFMEVHKSHRQHLRDVELLKEREKYLIVRQKYFKEKFPNFLTWHDKEQIRYLHETDPGEWTTERLSEGFPALPEIIKKIVTRKWTKTTQNKIINHDASVQKNWKMFKEGQIQDLPQALVEHLTKFTNRALILKQFVAPRETSKTVVTVKKKIRTEFADIITSCQKNATEPAQIEQEVSDDLPSNLPAFSQKGSRALVTLDQLQEQLQRKAESGRAIDDDDKLIATRVKLQHRNVETNNTESMDLVKNKYGTSGVQSLAKVEKDLSFLKYPDNIKIPKNIMQKGCVYKLNDCYYDDDGEFLYRVPGMT